MADNTIGRFHVIPQQKHQKITDFGASACWWATGYGQKEQVDKYLDLLFGDKGLGLNVLRINVGGSVKADLSDTCTHGGLPRSPASPLDEEGHFDIKRDLGSFIVAKKAAALGKIDDFTLFMNSPPTTMTKNGKTYHPIPLPAPDVAIWDQAVAASIKMPGYHHKRERRITRGPVLPYPIAKLGAMTANIPDGKPNVISAERELTIPVNKAASALWFVGQATMGKGYPINGTNGHEYGSYVITYSDGTEEVLPLRDGVESATVFGLIGPTAFDPRAAKTSRAFTIDYDRNWEVYHAGLLRIPTASKVISSVTVRITDENYYLLLYGVTVEE